MSLDSPGGGVAPPLRVAVLGARGRMGRRACEAVSDAPDLELVAALGRGDDLAQVADADAQVVVDFTVPSAVMGNVEWCLSHGVHVVTGTTGWTAQRPAAPRGWCEEAPRPRALVAPHLGIGAALALRFAPQAARHLPSLAVGAPHPPATVDRPPRTARDARRPIAQRAPGAAARSGGAPPAPGAARLTTAPARGRGRPRRAPRRRSGGAARAARRRARSRPRR